MRMMDAEGLTKDNRKKAKSFFLLQEMEIWMQYIKDQIESAEEGDDGGSTLQSSINDD